MNCLTLAAEVPDPCPRMVEGKCGPCRDALLGHAAHIQFDGQGCYTREESDALARRLAVEAMERMGAQRELF